MPEMQSQTVPSLAIPGYGKPPQLTADEAERYGEYMELVAEQEERGWEQASLINLHPFAITPNGVLHKEKKIAGVPLDEEAWKTSPTLELMSGARVPFVHHVIANWEPSIAEVVKGTEGNYSGTLRRRVVLPMELARDIFTQNNSPEQKGGVFIYKGAHRPFTDPKTYDEERALFEQAHTAQLAFYDAKYMQADTTFMKQNDAEWREIGPYHRWITQYLIRIGRLAETPKWFTEILKPGANKTVQTCVCGARVKLDAIKCKDCGYILDAYGAFDRYVMGLDSPGSLLILKRLKRNQIESLIKAERFSEEELEAVGYTLNHKAKSKNEEKSGNK